MGLDLAEDLRRLLLRFESLGDNCEFGLAQRRAGAESLGLMRFTGHELSGLRQGLQNGFEGLTRDADLYVGHGGEYVTLARRYGFHLHTFRQQGAIEPDRLREREARRLDFLRRLMMEDLRAAKKIFVRKSNAPPPRGDVDGLFADLSAHGPNTLLWVSPPEPGRPHLSVEFARPGLMRGYLDRFAPYEDAHRIDFDSWFRLCAKARAMQAAVLEQAARIGAEPSEPSRMVRAESLQWHGDLLLGANARLQHLQHGSLGGYEEREDSLTVRWDEFASEVFVLRSGVFRSIGAPAAGARTAAMEAAA